jgi:hypothetical protein
VAKSWFSDEECRQAGFFPPMIETLKKIVDFVDTVDRVGTVEDALGLSSRWTPRLPLAALDAVAGLLEQTGADAFTKRLLGCCGFDQRSDAGRCRPEIRQAGLGRGMDCGNGD